ncbi:hypothetical protein ACER0A_011780 [Haloimpatiens sp. FM7315]
MFFLCSLKTNKKCSRNIKSKLSEFNEFNKLIYIKRIVKIL